MGGYGIELRMDVLHNAAKHQMLGPLSSHGWNASIVEESKDGEYLVIDATKGTKKHSVALMYSSATDNRHYKWLEGRVNHIFINGQLYHVQSYARGINTPVSSLDDFFPLLVEWNKELAPPKLSKKVANHSDTILRIVSENPLASIWSRLNQFSSSELAKKLVLRRAEKDGLELTNEQVLSKASGIAFALGNAADYYKGAPNESLNKRVLSLYYGTLSFAFAEMLAAPNGPSDLDQLEGMTKQGHGLFAMSSVTGHFGDLKVGVLATGFYPNWVNFLGYDTGFYPKAKAKSVGDLDKSDKFPSQSFADMSVLLSAIPELGDLFTQVYDDEPAWVIPYIDKFSQHAKASADTSSSYIFLKDKSRKISEAQLTSQDWPLSEITKVDTNDHSAIFRARIDHQGLTSWHDALLLHRSPYLSSPTLILPVLGGAPEYRVTSFAILYSLSILVRYMPSAWRRVEGGDWDQHLSVMRAVLDVFERVLPQQFLESILGERVHTSLPGAFT